MMTRLFPALGLACLLAAPVSAMPCDGIDLSLREAVQEVLTRAKDPMIATWAGYLNDNFYTDLSCKLSGEMSAEEVLHLRADPVALIDYVLGMNTPRNQSDALMLMLSAMQEGAKT